MPIKNDSSSESPTKKSLRKISSAQSQRIKSAGSKKGSDGSEDFNLDLTVKTKNSRHLFQGTKQDSLLYSAGSDFDLKFANRDKADYIE